jgi:glycosyltransferase involved in cell wall biosynthesis
MCERYADTVIVPSKWARSVLEPRLPQMNLRVVRHGVLKGFRRRFEPWENDLGKFVVAHFATSAIERKNTLLLIDAFRLIAKSGRDSELKLFIGPNDLETVQRHIRPTDAVTLHHRLNAPPEVMRAVYSSASVVCQPSLAEGFGLVPLEALCSGVPAVLSDCSGHREYSRSVNDNILPSVVTIQPEGTHRVKYDPLGEAYTITVEGIREALLYAYDHFFELKQNAVRLAASMQEAWSWENTTRDYFEELKESTHARS